MNNDAYYATPKIAASIESGRHHTWNKVEIQYLSLSLILRGSGDPTLTCVCVCVSPNSQFPRVSLVLDTGVKRQDVHPRIPLFNEVERPGHWIAFPLPKNYLLKQFQEAGIRRNLSGVSQLQLQSQSWP